MSLGSKDAVAVTGLYVFQVVLDVVVSHEHVDITGISPAEDLVVELLHQGLAGCRLSLAHHEPSLSACI